MEKVVKRNLWYRYGLFRKQEFKLNFLYLFWYFDWSKLVQVVIMNMNVIQNI